MKEQKFICTSKCEQELKIIIDRYKHEKIFIVHGKSFDSFSWKKWFIDNYNICLFDEFEVNPQYESVLRGREKFLKSKSDIIIAIGGGSAIDVAKCIKLFANMEECDNLLKETTQRCDTPLIAIPTTAGTGSESTKFAVIYYNGEKQSVTDERILPDVVVLDERVLDTLPLMQKKVTICDALAHGIEAYWSINASEESRKYSKKAIEIITDKYTEFLNNNKQTYMDFLLASNYAGKGINLACTTAGHAMSYKITSMFGLPHGQSVIICLPTIWRHMIVRADEKLTIIFEQIADAMGCKSVYDAIVYLENMIRNLSLTPHIDITDEQIVQLVDSVNQGRLKNNPIQFNKQELFEMYREILILGRRIL